MRSVAAWCSSQERWTKEKEEEGRRREARLAEF